MSIVQIGDFGEIDGVRTFSIQGDKEDLEKIVVECRKMDTKFEIDPVVDFVRKGLWHVILKIKIPVNVGDEG
jgi:hypothetical protein